MTILLLPHLPPPPPANAEHLPDASDRCACGAVSDFGAHGVRAGSVFSEYFCAPCWAARRNH
jgi:hypothetical protein